MRRLFFSLVILILIASCIFEHSYCQTSNERDKLLLKRDAFLQSFGHFGYEIEKLGQPQLQVTSENSHQLEGDVQVAWVKHYAEGNSPGLDAAVDIAVDGAGNIYVVGKSQVSGVPFRFGAYDFVLIKYNPAGQRLWIRWFDGPSHGNDVPAALVLDKSGNIIVTGSSDFITESGYGASYATVKFDSAGQQLWTAHYFAGEETYRYPADIVCDGDGNVYVTGNSTYQGTQKEFVTIKYNPAGVEQWIARYDKTGNRNDTAAGIALDDSDNVFITGWSTAPETGEDYTTIKYNSPGIEQWVVRYNGNGVAPYNNDRAVDLAIDQNGNIYITGQSSLTYFDYDLVTVKYDRSGVQQWVQRYDGPGHQGDQPRKIALDNSGNIYVTGNSIGTNTRSDITTIKYMPDGTQSWVTRYNGYNAMDDYAADLLVDNSTKSIYVVGQSYEYSIERAWDFVSIKYDFSGNTQWFRNYNAYQVSNDYGKAVAVDQSGNVYVTGTAGYEEDRRRSYFATIKYDGSGEEQWVDQYNGMGIPFLYPNNFCKDDVGNFYIATWNPNSTLIKFNSDGVVVWNIQTGVTIWDMTVDHLRNIYITGSDYNETTGHDYFTAKYNSNGAEQWTARYNIGRFEEAYAIAVDRFENVYITGNTDSSTTIKYKPNGEMDWIVRYPGLARDIIIDFYGDIYLVGNSGLYKYNNDGTKSWSTGHTVYGMTLDEAGNVYTAGNRTIKFDKNGNIKWAADRASNGIAVDDSNNVFISMPGSDYIMAKFDSSGSEKWIVNYDGPVNSTDQIRSFTFDHFGNVYVTGWSYGLSRTRDFLTIKYSPIGVQEWVARYHGYEEDEARWISVDYSGNVYVMGESCLRGFDYYTKYWSIITTIKYTQTPTSVKQEIINHPKEYSLFQNHPNPFNPTTTIRYALPRESFVTLKIFNLLGQEVVTLVDEMKPMGEHQVQWQAGDLPSGVYLYRLEVHSLDNKNSRSYEDIKKLILLK